MGAAEDLFAEILSGKHKRIKQFVEEGQAEGLHLDFKQKADRSHGKPGPEDKRTYSEALSGFANSDGGVIVWGVKCQARSGGDPDVATELKPITGHRAFTTNLNS